MSVATKLDQNSLLHILELIELRANKWQGTESLNNYYRKKLSSQEVSIYHFINRYNTYIDKFR